MRNPSSQRYVCESKGHSGDSREFDDAPEETWTRKLLSVPKHCKSCRAWIKSQQDEKLRCQDCSNIIRISRRYKISYHKRIGPWTNPQKCKQCELGEKSPESTDEWKPAKVAKAKQNLNDSLPIGRAVQHYKLIKYDQHPITRQQHFDKHIPGIPRASYLARNPRESKKKISNTSLVGQDATREEFFLKIALTVLRLSNIIRQYVDTQNGNVINVSLGNSNSYEITIIRPLEQLGNMCELVTSFDEFSENQILERIESENGKTARWK